jgi:pimeloyl-ACP methyl ester carboxylesterase
MSLIDIDGITVGYDDVGSGMPLVLVHGHPFDRSMWQPQVAHFGRSGWRVIAPDLRGYGESTVVPGLTPLETFARDLAALLDRLGLERVVLGGLSMGGQIVLEFHRLFPERIRGLLLADTFAQAETEDGRRARNDTADRLLREGMARYADELLPQMIARATVAALPAVAERVLDMMRAAPAAGAAAALRGRAERPDYVDMLAQISVPTLIAVGRDDEFTPVSDAKFLRDRIADATLVIIERAGHLPNLEQPAAFNLALTPFLNALPPTPPGTR